MIAPDGSPVLTHRLEVFQQARPLFSLPGLCTSDWVHKINYASLMTSTLTFGLTKLSVLLLYKRYIHLMDV